MRLIKITIAVILLFPIQKGFGQQQSNSWDNWKFLIGEWVGEGNGQPGQGTGLFTFSNDLDSKILTRRSHTEFPATKDRPAFSHDDLLIIYFDYTGTPSKAIYFDNENHVLNYTVSYSNSSIILLSEVIKNAPRFRLSYIPIDSKTVNVKFEIAMPQNIEDFKVYLEGKSIRKE